MRFADAHESLEEPLELPIRGKVYEIPPVGAADGIRLQEFMADIQDMARKRQAGELTDDDTEKFGSNDSLDELEEVSLTKDVREQMFADGVPLRIVKVAGMTAFYWQAIQDGGETAKAYWESGGKAPRPNRAQRRTATQTRQGAATTTKKQGSRTGTKPKAAASKSKG